MIFYRNFFFTACALMIGALSLVCVPGAARAADDVFTVSEIKVDVTAENAVAAREKAFAEAQTLAFRALALRLLGEDEAKIYPVPAPSYISTMIKDFEITNERLSAVEYIGTYTIRFDGPAVRRQFNMEGMQYGAVPTKPVLVLPFYQMGSRITLWQDANPALAAWSRSNTQGGLVQLRVPMGDIRDVADVGDDQALTYRRDGMAQILERYGAGEAVVMITVPGPLDAGNVPSDISTMIYRTDRDMAEYVQTVKTLPDAGSTADALYDKAVREVRAALQRDWKAQASGYNNPYAPPGDGVDDSYDTTQPAGNIMTVRAQFATMQQWIETRQAIRRIPGLVGMKVRSVTPREAVVEIEYRGDESFLRVGIEQQGMALTAPDYQHAYGAAVIYGLFLKKYAPL